MMINMHKAIREGKRLVQMYNAEELQIIVDHIEASAIFRTGPRSLTKFRERIDIDQKPQINEKCPQYHEGKCTFHTLNFGKCNPSCSKYNLVVKK